jgi:hypothetical protein
MVVGVYEGSYYPSAACKAQDIRTGTYRFNEIREKSSTVHCQTIVNGRVLIIISMTYHFGLLGWVDIIRCLERSGGV